MLKYYRFYIPSARRGHDQHRVVVRKDEHGVPLEHWLVTCLPGTETGCSVFHSKGRYELGNLPRKMGSWGSTPEDVRELILSRVGEPRNKSRPRPIRQPQYWPPDA